MSKRISFFVILAVLCAALAMVIGCGGGSEEWQTDETYHWHDDSDMAKHTFGEWKTETAATCAEEGTETATCTVCAYKGTRNTEKTAHTFGTAYGSDATNHWNTATCGHTSEKSNVEKHAYVNGKCVCGKEQPATEGLVYEKKGASSAILVGITDGVDLSGAVIIDNKFSGAKVTGIAAGVFAGQTEITSITLPSTISEIGDGAFDGCIGLTEVVLPSSVKTIGAYAFRNCKAVTTVTIGDAVRTIGDHAFDGCAKLDGVVIPKTTTAIGAYAFNACTSLKNLTLNTGLKTIGIRAFSDCTALANIVLPTGLTRIGKSAFAGTAFATAANYESGVFYSGTYLLKADSAISGEYTIKTGTTLIADGAFDGCINLLKVNGVTSDIKGDKTFAGCVKKINAGTLITEDDFVFLKDDSNNYFLMGYTGTATTVTLPSTIDGNQYAIYKYAFAGRTDITGVTMTAGVTAIGDSAFEACTALTTVTIGADTLTIGKEAFNACYALATLTIGEEVTTIGEVAFGGCVFTELTIPASVTTIDERAFLACKGIVKVTWKAVNATVASGAFKNCESIDELYISDIAAYMVGVEFADDEAHPFSYWNETDSNKVFLLDGMTEVTGVFFDSGTRIGSYVFYNCDRITSLTINANAVTIGKGAFACFGTGGLTTVNCSTTGWKLYERENSSVAGIVINATDTLTADALKDAILHFAMIK